MSNRLINILVPLIAVVVGLIAGAVIMLVAGYDPIAGYSALWTGIFESSYTMGETVRQVTPYIFAGLSVAFAFRTGLFNIGVEGQLMVGWLTAVWVGTSFDLPFFIHLPFAVIAAGIAGGLWALLPGLLKAKLKVNEVIVTIMLNYTALHVTNSVIRMMSNNGEKTAEIKETASLYSEFFANITNYSRMHYGIFIALTALFIFWFLLEKTTLGYELRSVGFNKNASEYAGMNVTRNIVLSMVISGVFAGLGGAMEALGTFGYASIQTGFTGIGFDGIAVALLGVNNAIGIFLSSILFGALKVGGLRMPDANVPTELVSIVIAIIIFFVATSYVIRLALERFGKKREVK